LDGLNRCGRPLDIESNHRRASSNVFSAFGRVVGAGFRTCPPDLGRKSVFDGINISALWRFCGVSSVFLLILDVGSHEVNRYSFMGFIVLRQRRFGETAPRLTARLNDCLHPSKSGEQRFRMPSFAGPSLSRTAFFELRFLASALCRTWQWGILRVERLGRRLWRSFGAAWPSADDSGCEIVC